MTYRNLLYFKISVYALVIALVAVLDATVISTLPYGLFRLHLLPLALVFVVLLSNLRVAAWWALLGGLVLELFSFRTFGMYLGMTWLVLVLIAFLFEKVMTNRSLYSVALISASVIVVYDGLFLLFDYWSGVILLPAGTLFYSFAWSLLVNVIASIIAFNIFHVISRRLRPVFLNTKR